MSTVRIVLQARTDSSRLPAKVLLPIGGLPLAVLCAKRLSNAGRDVVLATSRESSDDLLSSISSDYGVRVFRGSLKDVLERFIDCTADLDNDDVIVRTTADNPLPDGALIESLLHEFGESDTSYLGTNSPLDGLPYGLSAEVFTVGALRRSVGDQLDAFAREHVTVALRLSAGKAGVIRRGLLASVDRSDLRVTIDTLADYLRMASLFRTVDRPIHVSWQELVDSIALAGRVATSTKTTVSLALGTAQLGMDYGVANRHGRPSDADARDIIETARAAGVAYFDTAREYGDAERRLGSLLSNHASDRPRIFSKVRPLVDLPDDASTSEVDRAVDASVHDSCLNLRVSRIDVVMLHRYEDLCRWQGAAVSRLVHLAHSGLIGEVGVSVYTPEQALCALGDPRVRHVQIPFNILDQRWLSPEFQEALAVRPDVHVHARSIFLQGLLINDAQIWPEWAEEAEQYAEKLSIFASRFSRQNKADLCLAYVRAFSWLDSVVLGVDSAEHVRELIALFKKPPLSVDEVSIVRAEFKNVRERLLNPALWI